METNKQNIIPDDIQYHLELILRDLYRLKVDYNRDDRIVHTSDFLTNKILLIISIYLGSETKKFHALRNKLNSLFKEDPKLKGVLVQIKNSKNTSDTGSIKHFTHII